MAHALADADVLVVPSVWIENAPFIIREAFAAGLPVVASDLGGMAEMVFHDRNGLLFPPGDAGALADQLSRLLHEDGLVERLRRGIERPMSIEQDALEMTRRYAALARRRSRRTANLEPAHGKTRVTAVVLNYRTSDQTFLAVRSIQSSRDGADVIVVDNGSNDGSVERLTAALPDCRILPVDRNLGFSGGCNAGIREALDDGADMVLLVNSDVVLSPRAIGALRQAADSNPDAGILAPVLLSREEPDRVASAGIRFSAATGRMRHICAGQPLAMLPPAAAHRVDAVSGCVMMVRRTVFESRGVFDEDFFFSFEDIEFCLRARAGGFTVLCVPEAIAYHEGGHSIGRLSPGRVYYAARNHLRLVEMRSDEGVAPPSGLRTALRGGLVVGMNAAYVLLSGETPRLRGLAALTRGVWHHLNGRYGPA
jgi:GT2 family glycosyltransferase